MRQQFKESITALEEQQSDNDYFEACCYANRVLGDAASRRFPDLRQLARDHDLPHLRRLIDSWAQMTTVPPVLDWTPGMQWGNLTLVKHIAGIVWGCRCSCGMAVEQVSCNYTTPDPLRKCSNCQLSDAMTDSRQWIVKGLTETAAKVLDLHRQHDRLTWFKIRGAFAMKQIAYNHDLAVELHAMIWAKVTEKLSTYEDRGLKVTGWLGTICDNLLRDFFKQQSNRHRLVPTIPLESVDFKVSTPDTGFCSQGIPNQPCRPRGNEPDTLLTEDPIAGLEAEDAGFRVDPADAACRSNAVEYSHIQSDLEQEWWGN
jgi:hypothetical protein